MPFIAPLLLSILTHVVFVLSTALVTIMSMWTQRRVSMATSFASAFSDVPPLFKPRAMSFRKRRPDPISFNDFNFSAPLQRSHSVGSSPVPKAEAPSSPRSRVYRIPSSPLATSPVITAAEQADLDLMPAFSLSEKKGAFWMNTTTSAPSSPIKEDYFSFEPNSPTGSLLDGVTSDVPAWAKGQCSFDGERRSTGRKIIIALCVLRLCATFPLIWLEANLGHFAVSSQPFWFVGFNTYSNSPFRCLDCSWPATICCSWIVPLRQ